MPVLLARDLCKRYGTLRVLDHVSFQLAEGQVFGLLGPNGAGKSTTFRIIAGLQAPDSGTVLIDQFDTVRQRRDALLRLGYVPDDPLIYGHLTGVEFIRLMAGLYGVPDPEQRVQEVIRRFQVPEDTRLVREYSAGMRKKTAVAAAYLYRPRVFLLDEPFNALDHVATATLRQMISELRAQGHGVLIATHLLDVAAQICDVVAFLNNGHLTEPVPVRTAIDRFGDLTAAFLAHARGVD